MRCLSVGLSTERGLGARRLLRRADMLRTTGPARIAPGPFSLRLSRVAPRRLYGSSLPNAHEVHKAGSFRRGIPKCRFRLCSIQGTLLLALSVTRALRSPKRRRATTSGEKASEQQQLGRSPRRARRATTSPSRATAREHRQAAAANSSSSDTLGGGSAEPQEVAFPSRAGGSPPEEKEEDPWRRLPAPPEKPKGSDRPISAAISLGWGLKPIAQTNDIQARPSIWSFGGSLRGGYSFDFHLYVGVYIHDVPRQQREG